MGDSQVDEIFHCGWSAALRKTILAGREVSTLFLRVHEDSIDISQYRELGPFSFMSRDENDENRLTVSILIGCVNEWYTVNQELFSATILKLEEFFLKHVIFKF